MADEPIQIKRYPNRRFYAQHEQVRLLARN